MIRFVIPLVDHSINNFQHLIDLLFLEDSFGIKIFNMKKINFIGLIVDTLSSLLELTHLPELLKPQRNQAFNLIKDLKRAGFTNHEIEVLINGRWSESTIKRETRGVKSTSKTEKDAVLQTFSNFTLRGYKPEDAEGYMRTRDLLDEIGLEMNVFLDLLKKLIEHDIPIMDLITLQHRLEQASQSVEDLTNMITKYNNLIEKGLTPEILNFLQKSAEKFGGLQGLLKALDQYENLENMEKIRESFSKELIKIEKEQEEINQFNERLNNEAIRFSSIIDFTRKLVEESNFDYNSIIMLTQAAEKFGKPFQIIEAINTFGNLENLKTETNKLSSEKALLAEENKKLKAEYETLRKFVQEANQDLGEIKAKYQESRRIGILCDLILEPSRMEVEPEEFIRLSLMILSGMLQYGKSHARDLEKWDRSVKFLVKRAADGCTDLLS